MLLTESREEYYAIHVVRQRLHPPISCLCKVPYLHEEGHRDAHARSRLPLQRFAKREMSRMSAGPVVGDPRGLYRLSIIIDQIICHLKNRRNQAVVGISVNPPNVVRLANTS
jgi:hypothetical protein